MASWARSGIVRNRSMFSGRGRSLLVTGAALAATAATVWAAARRAERANPPSGKFIDIDGVRLHYVERGQGQPLVLLHGNGMMIQDFETSGLLDLASASYRVIAFDRPGYGYSERPRRKTWTPTAQAKLLHQALQRLGVERPVVVGHSWGTLVAVALALEYPADVRSLVLLSGYYYPTFRADVALLAPPAIPVIGDVLRYTLSPLLSRLTWPLFLRLLFGPPAVPPRFAQFPVSMAVRPSQIRAAASEAALLVPGAIALRSRYRELTLPVSIVAGAKDRYVRTKRQSTRLHDELPHSMLRLIPGAGHMVHHVAPQDVMAAIDAAANAPLLQVAGGTTRELPSVRPSR